MTLEHQKSCVILQVLKLLLPIWVMLFVFHPLPPAGDQEDLIPAFSEDGVSIINLMLVLFTVYW